MHGSERAAAQYGHLRRRVRCDGAGAELPKVDADIRACGGDARTGAGASNGSVFEEDDEVLCGVKGKSP